MERGYFKNDESKDKNAEIRFDKENNLYYVDIKAKTSRIKNGNKQNYTYDAVMYFTPEGKTKCFEPYSKSINRYTKKERHYYNRLTTIDNLKSIELATNYSNENEHLNGIFQKAVKDAIEKSKDKKKNRVKNNDFEVS